MNDLDQFALVLSHFCEILVIQGSSLPHEKVYPGKIEQRPCDEDQQDLQTVNGQDHCKNHQIEEGEHDGQ